MTSDQVIALNVRRLRDEAGISIRELADLLGVGEHVARDYERPRKGQPQRQFLWIDLVRLCYVLDVTLFDLVLPPEGVEVDGFAVRDEAGIKAATSLGRGQVVEWLQADGRSKLTDILFGFPLTADDLKSLDHLKRKEDEKVAAMFKDTALRYLAMVEGIREGEK